MFPKQQAPPKPNNFNGKDRRHEQQERVHEYYQEPRREQPQSRPKQPQGKSESFAYKLWNFADVDRISERADAWAATVRNGASRNAYLASSIILFVIFALLALIFDLLPSYEFASAWAENGILLGLTKYNISLDTIQNAKLTLVFGFTLVPTLLEFFGTGLALNGQDVANWFIKVFIIFDVLTDLAPSIAMGSWIVDYFVKSQGIFHSALTLWICTVWLACSTIFFETMAITYAISIWRFMRPSR